ncbi:hypothetical protein AVEN_65957-1 [Araneus ventricosus]|uniref:Uncharacterized protein n=1 Tax=Araneus ventricosus TaxID=182803 RepID=A0A4Y2WQN0_ARAVE|nr:hypothetical protein AVEN_65957-1 [Araneus ventricosus]
MELSGEIGISAPNRDIEKILVFLRSFILLPKSPSLSLWKVFDIVDGAPAVLGDVSGDVAYIWMLPSTTNVGILAWLLARTCSCQLFRHGSHLSLQRIKLLGLSVTSMCVE